MTKNISVLWDNKNQPMRIADREKIPEFRKQLTEMTAQLEEILKAKEEALKLISDQNGDEATKAVAYIYWMRHTVDDLRLAAAHLQETFLASMT